jgi:hypothetical protein
MCCWVQRRPRQSGGHMVKTRSNQLEVEIFDVNTQHGYVSGYKRNLQRLGTGGLFSVYFRDDEPVRVDGAGRPHPRLVLAAASAAWRNRPAVDALRTVDTLPKPC